MKSVLMNMCRIVDEENNKILILDKTKKHGWEGLTFPGGHLEKEESLIDSTIREIKEESGLTIKNPKIIGLIQWIHLDENKREVGFLLETSDFEGELLNNHPEGKCYWVDEKEFREMDGLSYSMKEILKVYDGECQEVIMKFNHSERGMERLSLEFR